MLVTLVAGVIAFSPATAQTLLKAGAKVPDFTLKTPSGSPVTFSKVYSKNKATILNFWFYH
jgi:hypothetical protein